MSAKDQSGGAAPSGEPPDRNNERNSRPVSDAMLAIFLAALAAALVLGYLFLNRLVDISRQEDCMLSRSRNCAAIELPSDR
jgi:type VI protein secretion system component VasF